ncbi:MAG: AAA family ATPase [Caldilineaceae bacterium]
MTTELTIQVFGNLSIQLGPNALTQQLPVKAQGLLVYLACTRRPHSRSALAGLFWAELTEEAARANLRLVLSRLRAALGDALLITRQSVAFNLTFPHRFDVAEFDELASDAERLSNAELARAVELYAGPLLNDFQIRDAPDFELWIISERERWQRQSVALLFILGERCRQSGQLAEAIATARRILELEPWLEEAHQLLMRLLSVSGQRSAALAHYDICRQVLAKELAVEPAAATVALYEAIRDETADAPVAPDASARATAIHAQEPSALSTQPSFLTDANVAPATRPVFVARERELTQLASMLMRAQQGQGLPFFVLGGAGSGKSTLLGEFARRAQAADGELIVAWGNCNAHTGIGEPYAPFRELLLLLTGDVEARWQSELLTPALALRLWEFMPVALPLLMEHGPDLVGSFVGGEMLLKRVQRALPAGAYWGPRLTELSVAGRDVKPEQRQLFSQFAAFFKALSTTRPLLLFLENLHWADSSSLSLLFSLCQQLHDRAILIVASYRPEEVNAGVGNEARALQELVAECKRLYGDVIVDLGDISAAEEIHFVQEYLRSQPNHFADAFVQRLVRHTEGHPLFTVELMRDLQEQGVIQQDEAGYWREVSAVDWQRLPARVEGVIEKRIGRLDANLQALLAVAAVEGNTFTAELLAQVQGVNERLVIQRLSRELDRQHRLITVQALESVNGQRLSRYRFRHQLFQYYLYGRLDAVERAYLHEAVGAALEQLYGAQPALAAALARHFELAGLGGRAIEYLTLAGEHAAQLSAYNEAATHFQHGLTLLQALPDRAAHQSAELRLQIGLCNALLVTKGYAAPEVEAAYQQAYALCAAAGETDALFSVYYGLWTFFHVRGHHARGRALGEQWLAQAGARGDVVPLMTGHRALGVSLLHLGQLAAARHHLEQCLRLYRSNADATLTLRYGADPGAAAAILLAWALWLLGEGDAAMQHYQEALRLAQAAAHPFTAAFVSVHAGMLHIFANNTAAAHAETEHALRVCHAHSYPFWHAVALCLDGYLRFRKGAVESGIAQMVQALAAYADMGADLWRPWLLGLLAQAYAGDGQADAAQAARRQADELVAQIEERWHKRMLEGRN